MRQSILLILAYMASGNQYIDMSQIAEPNPERVLPHDVVDSVSQAMLIEEGAYVIRDEDDDIPERGKEIFHTQDTTKAYLRSIGATALLNAEQEVEFSKRIEVGKLASVLILRRTAEAINVGRGNATSEEELSKAVQHFKDVPISDLKLIEAEGQEAFGIMVQANLRLVVSIAKKYVYSELSFMDLIQEGNIGLHRAVEKFDYKKGYKFSTYATWWIRQAITRSIADTGRTIRVPVHASEFISSIRRVQKELTAQLGREPSNQEVATILNTTDAKVAEFINYDRRPLSIDEPLGNGGAPGRGEKSLTLADMNLAGGEHEQMQAEIEAHLMKEALYKILSVLPPREEEILVRRYGLDGEPPMTLDAVGRILGCTRERVRQIEKKAMERIKNNPATRAQFIDYIR